MKSITRLLGALGTRRQLPRVGKRIVGMGRIDERIDALGELCNRPRLFRAARRRAGQHWHDAVFGSTVRPDYSSSKISFRRT
jgi:hypothetical protein